MLLLVSVMWLGKMSTSSVAKRITSINMVLMSAIGLNHTQRISFRHECVA